MRSVVVLVCFVLAGCSEGAAPAAEETLDTLVLEGVVVTEAIVPVANAAVSVVGQEVSTATDADGRFLIEGMEAGNYRLKVTAEGYAGTELVVDAMRPGDEIIKVVLVATSSNVPYHELEHFVGYIQCSVGFYVAPPGGQDLPCLGIVDIVTGVTVSQDVWMFHWSVTAPGLEGALIEVVWPSQPTGTHMGILLRNIAGAGSGVDAGGTNIDTQYASNSGTTPMLTWVHQGIENPGADTGARFQDPQNESMDYNLMVLGRTDRSQAASYHLYLEHEPEVFLTKFYHAMGSEDYSITS